MKKNIICWFEIYVKDIHRARDFYASVLSEKINEVVETPGGAGIPALKMASFATGKDSSIVSGALIEMEGTKAGDEKVVNTIVYFPTDDCIASEKKVAAAGGKILKSKFPVDAPGYCSLCLDTEGNPIGFFSWM
ncbi:VOC family protein [Pedobacter nutrimenti]|uniref:VOC family protein n=1 Tax=Pedobacter nutrimenti TaxID=1241337 RepID=UPI0029311DF8|nr:VOC family protein [Pedobacter nutrimenti]